MVLLVEQYIKAIAQPVKSAFQSLSLASGLSDLVPGISYVSVQAYTAWPFWGIFAQHRNASQACIHSPVPQSNRQSPCRQYRFDVVGWRRFEGQREFVVNRRIIDKDSNSRDQVKNRMLNLTPDRFSPPRLEARAELRPSWQSAFIRSCISGQSYNS